MPYIAPVAALSVAAEESQTGFTWQQLALVGVLGTVSTIAAIAVFRWLVRPTRLSTTVRLRHLVLNAVGSGAALGIVRIALVAAWTDAPLDAGLRLLGSISGALVWVPALSALQALLIIRSRSLRSLEHAQQQLQALQTDASDALTMQRDALAVAVRMSVAPHITRLLAQTNALQLAASPAALGLLAAQIQHVAADTVRTASHRVAEAKELTSSTGVGHGHILRAVAGDLLLRPIRSPWIVAAMILGGSGTELVRTNGGGAALAVGAVVIASGAVLSVSARGAARLGPRSGAVVQWVTLLFASAAVMMLPVAAGTDTAASHHQSVAILLFEPLMLAGTVVISGAIATRRETIQLLRRLAAQNRAVEAATRAVQADAEGYRRRVAAMLHGPVQGRLSAAAMLLNLHLAGDAGRDSFTVLTEVIALIQLAAKDLAELTSEEPPQENLTQTLQRLHTEWSGILAIDWTIDHAISDLPALDQALIVDVVTDMISNASRHGRARRAHLNIARDTGPASVAITCINDGIPPTGARTGGVLASAVRDRGGAWTLDQAVAGVRSRVSFPLHPAASGQPPPTARA